MTLNSLKKDFNRELHESHLEFPLRLHHYLTYVKNPSLLLELHWLPEWLQDWPQEKKEAEKLNPLLVALMVDLPFLLF